MEKKTLRQFIQQKLQTLSEEERRAQSVQVQSDIRTAPWYRSARSVGFYWPLPDEVDLRELCLDALASKKIYLPRIEEGEKMRLLPLPTLQEKVLGRYGLWEPPDDGRPDAVEMGSLDVLLVPGRAFDLHGGRCGRGGGYYDRYLKKILQKKLKTRLVGVCFREQIVHSVLRYENDQKVHQVLYCSEGE